MAEQRCPMCSKMNSDDVDVCVYCGARLTPLVISSGAEDSGKADDSGTPDWLARIRSDVEANKEPEPEAQPEAGDDDWLGRLRTSGDLPPEEEPRADASKATDSTAADVPGWVDTRSPDESVEQKAPEWLKRIRARERAERVEEPQEEQSGSGDWLSSLREKTGDTHEETGMGEEPVISSEFAPDDAVSEGEAGLPEIQDLADVLPLDEIPPPEPPADVEPALPGGFERIRKPTEEPVEKLPADNDWLEAFKEAGIAADDEPASEPPVADLPIPDIHAPEIEDVTDDELFAALEGFEDFPEQEKKEDERVAFHELEEVEWMGDVELPTSDTAPEEAYPEEPISQHTPPLIMDGDASPGAADSQELDFDAIELPEWLGELQETGDKISGEAKQPDEGITPATLPAWLEAMRPIDTFRSSVEIEPVDDQAVEAAGPLAGLRGVLMAEPVVAIPHQASIGSGRLDISERQFAQAELLHRMVDDEERELPLESLPQRRLPLVRWVISLLLLLAIGISIVTGTPDTNTFPLPARVPRDLGPFFTLVDELPAERPALLVFDFAPGYTAEFDAVASVVLEHLMRRNIAIATVSTQVNGPLLAARAIERSGAQHDLVNGVDYIHLGYLSGGPTAVQLFAAAPREAILQGFFLPDELEGQTAWVSPILQDVERLSDFSMVAVITAGTDSARVWAEQAHTFMGDTPLLMILSAGAEPLVRPYYESLSPQVDGILTGLPQAVAYEQMNGLAGDALARWDGFNAGMLVVEAVLLTGAMYGVIRWLLKPRRS